MIKRNCFEPVHVYDLTAEERARAQVALMFLTEKRTGQKKGRMVFNGKPTRDWLSREEASSPTVTQEGVSITASIDAHEGRDIMTNDIPNAFIQTLMPPPENGKERVIMKITGPLLEMIIQLDASFGSYVVMEKGKRVLYVVVLRAIYGMLQAALLWYRKFREDLEGIGFRFSEYDPCIATRDRYGAQHTVRFHVDDVMSSHIDPRVNDKFYNWLQRKYGTLKDVSVTRGKVHDYLGMTFNFENEGEVRISMDDYVARMLEEFPMEFKGEHTALTPAANDLFEIGKGNKLDKKTAECFHKTVARALFIAKRARPDIQPTVAVLATRVKSPNESDWKKLIRLLKYLNGTRKKGLTLKIDDVRVVKWYVDASFAVHPDFRSHTGGVMTMGKGAIQSTSKKQKLNTRSSTEAELVGWMMRLP